MTISGADEGDCRASERLDVGGHTCRTVGIEIQDSNGRARARGPHRNRPADPLRGTRDQNAPVGEVGGVR
jgi:hypothetical protein